MYNRASTAPDDMFVDASRRPHALLSYTRTACLLNPWTKRWQPGGTASGSARRFPGEQLTSVN